MIFAAITQQSQHGLPYCLSCGARSKSVCSAIEDKDVRRLADLATEIEIAPGIDFITEGDTAEHFFNLSAGVVKLYKLLPDGRRQITGFVRSGDFLGLAAAQTYAFSAQALSMVRACRFSRNKLCTMFDDFPAMERRLLESASNELVAAQNQMLLLGRKTARERVASFLASEAALVPSCQQGDRLALPMTRGDMADYLGLTIETVSRTMTALRKCGAIAFATASEVVILNKAALRLIADGPLN